MMLDNSVNVEIYDVFKYCGVLVRYLAMTTNTAVTR
jgi:hypothetical protein